MSNSNTLPSQHQINDNVDLDFADKGYIKDAKISKVLFSIKKVMYDVDVTTSKGHVRMHNIPSDVVVKPKSIKEVDYQSRFKVGDKVELILGVGCKLIDVEIINVNKSESGITYDLIYHNIVIMGVIDIHENINEIFGKDISLIPESELPPILQGKKIMIKTSR